MEKFSSAQPNTEEGASQSVQSYNVYVSSHFAFQITASWVAQSHNAVFRVVSCAKGRCVIRCSMALCDCVCRGTLRAAFSCALHGQKNVRMDPRVAFFAPARLLLLP